MFGLGFTEIVVLLLIAFLVFGPKKFPLVAKNFIRLLNELRRAWDEVQTEFQETRSEAEKHIQKIAKDVKNELDPSNNLPKTDLPPKAHKEKKTPPEKK